MDSRIFITRIPKTHKNIATIVFIQRFFVQRVKYKHKN